MFFHLSSKVFTLAPASIVVWSTWETSTSLRGHPHLWPFLPKKNTIRDGASTALLSKKLELATRLDWIPIRLFWLLEHLHLLTMTKEEKNDLWRQLLKSVPRPLPMSESRTRRPQVLQRPTQLFRNPTHCRYNQSRTLATYEVTSSTVKSLYECKRSVWSWILISILIAL